MKQKLKVYGTRLYPSQIKKVKTAKKKWGISEAGVIRHLIETYT